MLQKMGWSSGTGLGKHAQGMSFSWECVVVLLDLTESSWALFRYPQAH